MQRALRAFYAQNRTRKRQRFVDEYIVDLNATKAAERAGYSKKTANEQGSRLLKNPTVKAAIERKLQKQAEDSELRAQDIIDGIRATIRRCEGLGADFQPFAVLKGYELLGKHLKMWTDKLRVEGSLSLGPMTEKQMQERITELLAKRKEVRP